MRQLHDRLAPLHSLVHFHHLQLLLLGFDFLLAFRRVVSGSSLDEGRPVALQPRGCGAWQLVLLDLRERGVGVLKLGPLLCLIGKRWPGLGAPLL